MKRIFGKPLITQREIEKRIKELGTKISADYDGKDLVMICILKGGYIFFADLVRNIHVPVSVDFMMVSSYGPGTTSSNAVKIIADLSADIKDKDVLIVEDIVDSGLTLSYLYKTIKSKKPRTIKLCVLLDKVERRKYETPIDYVGFTIPNNFVIGYGLDYQDNFRNLPYIAVLDEHEADELLNHR
ncbi:MAG: hypoxanthine phosphoribosyltransferase [Nitrospirae bacterium]|nr:hypoxanthine phosphoribosyltransferase [Nitrospirota bacterium]